MVVLWNAVILNQFVKRHEISPPLRRGEGGVGRMIGGNSKLSAQQSKGPYMYVRRILYIQ